MHDAASLSSSSRTGGHTPRDAGCFVLLALTGMPSEVIQFEWTRCLARYAVGQRALSAARFRRRSNEENAAPPRGSRRRNDR